MIIRPHDYGIDRLNDNICLAVAAVPCEFSRETDDVTWVCPGDAPAVRPRDDDPPSRKRDYAVNRPGDNDPAQRAQDNPEIKRPSDDSWHA